MRSIRGRLLVGTALGVSAAFVISGILVLVLARSSLYTQFDEALIARARALSALVEQDGDTVELELDPAGTPGDAAYFELWTGERVLLRSTSLAGKNLSRSPGELAVGAIELPDGNDGRQVTLRFPARREPDEAHTAGPPATVTLVLARSTDEVSGAISRIAKVLIGVGIFGTLLCLAILAGVVRFGLAPVRSLAAAIAELREGDLAVGLAGDAANELRPVVDRLDDLLRRLGAAITRERELTAEVAHELRTPLAGLRATIEVSLSREDRPPEKYRSALTECLAITRQTEALVETMLSLARLDAGSLTATSDPVDIDELVREVLAPMSARAAERNVTMTTELAPVTASTDRAKLRLVVQNLIENAVSYVDDGGTIRIELAGRSLKITNTGCTLAAADIAHVFERFWRGDAARSSGAHAGLGLALCKKLVAILGGTITAEIVDHTFIATVTV